MPCLNGFQLHSRSVPLKEIVKHLFPVLIDIERKFIRLVKRSNCAMSWNTSDISSALFPVLRVL